MDFKTALENYKNGTATPEEEVFVLRLLSKAERLCALLDDVDEMRQIQKALEEEEPGRKSDKTLEEDKTERKSHVEKGRLSFYEGSPAEAKDGFAAKAKYAAERAFDGLRKTAKKIGARISHAGEGEAKRVKRRIRQKTILTTLTVCFAVIMALAAAAAGTVFGIAVPSANKNKAVSKAEAENLAFEWMDQNAARLAEDGDLPLFLEIGSEIKLQLNLKESYIEYEVKFECVKSKKIFVVSINSANGEAGLKKIIVQTKQ